MTGKFIKTLLILSLALLCSSCSNSNKLETKKMPKTYKVKRLTASRTFIDANWDKPQWTRIQPLDVQLFMGDDPAHKPKTQAKLFYDDKNIYVIFKVQDNYIRAVNTDYQSPVSRDSCVEFFFTPGPDTTKGYFNLETNCIGTVLLYHQTARDENKTEIAAADLDQIAIATSLPKEPIDPERQGPVTWILEYRLPIKMLEKYHSVTKPTPGVKWYANFYKCADRTSQPHWLTWSLVDKEEPDFHLSEFFGTLEFTE